MTVQSPVSDFKLIGLTGPAGCGKDTVAFHLCDAHDFARYALAGPIKDMLRAIGVDAETRETKELPHPVFGVSPRRMAQTLGTEWMRDRVCEDGWLRLAARRVVEARASGCFRRRGELRRCRGLVITDVRFENEAAWVRSQGGSIWHISRSAVAPVEAHSSEAGVHFLAITDELIPNDASFEALYRTVDARFTV